MKSKAFHLTIAAAAAAALVAACGGGSSDGGTPAASTPAGIVLSGTAATGLALASAPVTAKCATGTATATTNANGVYTMTVEGGALPCLLEVTATVNGNAVTLHSVAEAGTTSGSSTAATANVTPLTELIVASLLGKLPADAFASFAGTTITAKQVSDAAAAVLAAVKDATGVDLGSVDPFKGTLVAATTSSPTGGNAYDKALDTLATKISVQSLPLFTTQIVNAGSSGGTSALSQALSSAPGCPSAVSGRYRAVGLTGSVILGTFDFKNMSVQFDGHTASAPIAQNPNQACDFSIGTAQFSESADNRFAIGTQGAGAFRGAFFLDSSDIVNGYLFPVQQNTPDFAAAATASPWLVAQTGIATDETPQRVNRLSQLTFKADGTDKTKASLSTCDYDNAALWVGSCTADNGVDNVAATSNGVELRQGSIARARLWSFRSPSGSATLYGTTRVDPNTTTTEMTSLIATRQTKLALPTVGGTSRSLTVTTGGSSSGPAILVPNAPTMSAFTTDTVDANADSYSRSGNNAGTTVTNEVWLNNKPQNGVRVAQVTAPAVQNRIQMPVLGAGLTISLRPTTTNSGFTQSISVAMPTTTPTGGTAPAPTAIQVQ